jgi:hypothetical protein
MCASGKGVVLHSASALVIDIHSALNVIRCVLLEAIRPTLRVVFAALCLRFRFRFSSGLPLLVVSAA